MVFTLHCLRPNHKFFNKKLKLSYIIKRYLVPRFMGSNCVHSFTKHGSLGGCQYKQRCFFRSRRQPPIILAFV